MGPSWVGLQFECHRRASRDRGRPRLPPRCRARCRTWRRLGASGICPHAASRCEPTAIAYSDDGGLPTGAVTRRSRTARSELSPSFSDTTFAKGASLIRERDRLHRRGRSAERRFQRYRTSRARWDPRPAQRRADVTSRRRSSRHQRPPSRTPLPMSTESERFSTSCAARRACWSRTSSVCRRSSTALALFAPESTRCA